MKDFIDIHFNVNLLYLYLSGLKKYDDYDIYYSDFIDDEYWNFAYLKNEDVSLDKAFCEIKMNMDKLQRTPVIYITSDIINSKLQEQIDNSKLKLLYTDFWMTLDNLDQFESYKSKIDFSVCKVDESTKKQFIQASMDIFSDDNPDNPYVGLLDGYRVALERSFNVSDNDYKVVHYVGKTNNEILSTATVAYKKDKAIIYNVSTNKKYQRNGVCRQTMSDLIKELIKLNIKEVCVQTEHEYYTEQVYKNMGFEGRLLGQAYIEGE